MRIIKISIVFFLAKFAWAQGIDSYGMKPVPVPSGAGQYEIIDMPRTRSQDSLGLCYAFAAATLIDRQTCVDKKISCATLPDELRVSPLDMARYGKVPPNGLPRDDRSNYQGIEEGGGLDLTLKNALRAGGVISSEACAPFYQIVANNPDPARREEIERNFWQRLRHLYEQSKLRPGCRDCDLETATALDELRKDFALKSSNEEILRAFAQDSFAHFLDKALIAEDCGFMGLADINPKYQVEVFPMNDLPSNTPEKFDKSYKEMLSQIKTVLKDKKVPLGLNFCAEPGTLTFKSIKECSSSPNETSSVSGFGHSVVISGYRRVCKNGDKDCYDAIKVENSWGQQWQDENNDGWVDAKELLKRSFFSKASLTWLEKKTYK